MDVLENLRQSIEELQLGYDSESLREALAIRDQLDARIAEALGVFDAQGYWEFDGATSLTGWLKAFAGMTSTEAGRLANTAKRVRELPVTREAWMSGDLSGGQVATVLASVRPEHREVFAEQEADVIPTLAALDVRDTGRVIAHWTSHAEALVEQPVAPERERSLYASKALDDRLLLEADLDSDSGEIVLTALRVAETKDAPDEEQRSAATRRADALVDVCRYFLDTQTAHPGGRHRPHVNVVVEADDLYAARRVRYLGGGPVSPDSAASILCDAVVHRVVVDPEGAILDYGRATRTISAAIWSALVVRDEGCRFPGCDRPAKWSEAHHVVWFSVGGETSLDNLILLCSRHHHLIHRPGWETKLKPDGTFEVTDPGGRVRSTSPPRALLRL